MIIHFRIEASINDLFIVNNALFLVTHSLLSPLFLKQYTSLVSLRQSFEIFHLTLVGVCYLLLVERIVLLLHIEV